MHYSSYLIPMSKPIASSKITSSFQISLPKAVRAKLNAEIGDLVLFIERDGEILLRTSVNMPRFNILSISPIKRVG